MNIQLLFLPFFVALSLTSLSILGRSRDIISIIFSFAPFVVLCLLFYEGSEFLYHYQISVITTLSFQFRIDDGIAIFFGLIITLSAPVVAILIYRQRLSERFSARFHPLFHLLLGGVLILILAGDFISFIVGWEIINWSSYFLLMLNRKEHRKSLLDYLIITQISTYTLFFVALIIYSLTGSFVFYGNESLLVALAEPIQLLIVYLLLFAFLIRIGAVFLLEARLTIIASNSKALSLFLSVALSKIPLYGLFLFSFYFIFDYLEADSLTRVLYQNSLALIGATTIFVGYYNVFKWRGTAKFLPSLALMENGYLFVLLASLSYFSFGGFFLMLLNNTLSLMLLYIVWLYPHRLYFGRRNNAVHRYFSLSSFIGAFSLLGFPPFFGFSLKVMLLESLLYEKLYVVAIFTFIGYLFTIWLLLGQLRLAYIQIKRRQFHISEPMSFLALFIASLILMLGIFPILQQKIVNFLFQSVRWHGVSWASFPIFDMLSNSMIPYLSLVMIFGVFIGSWVIFLRSHSYKEKADQES
ncbi:MAG: proton-conducting transporter transmembrane domain-containing protein [Wolinella sp.]